MQSFQAGSVVIIAGLTLFALVTVLRAALFGQDAL